jgi:alginate O-acetyltransferase complex protein AlgI
VLLLALSAPLSTRRKKHVLAVGSCLFYAAWDYRYLALLLGVSVIDYWCAARIHASDHVRSRRCFLALSVTSNLGLLGYFKYYNFFSGTLNGFLPHAVHLPHLAILLPAGISFYTFKSLSYTIDVYRREIKPCRSHLDYTTFVTFFPELIAGPIVRASIFLPQMDQNIGLTRERFARGASLFLLGLSKKLLIADRMAGVADRVFKDPDLYSSLTLWCGVLAYGLQIYTDFSGYSDMAIGTAKLIGYDLPENFNMPYASRNVTEFWHRWHMTLSTWLRDYLYIPIGGNRGSTRRTYVNLNVTMLLGGLWHGASWNFVLWGVLHGVALSIHRYISRRPRYRPWPFWIAQPATLLFVMLCWVPFRSISFHAALTIFYRLFTPGLGGARWYPEWLGWCTLSVLAGHFVGFELARAGAGGPSRRPVERVLAVLGAHLVHDPISGVFLRLGIASIAGAFTVAFWCMIVFYFSAVTASPFIYFQF